MPIIVADMVRKPGFISPTYSPPVSLPSAVFAALPAFALLGLIQVSYAASLAPLSEGGPRSETPGIPLQPNIPTACKAPN